MPAGLPACRLHALAASSVRAALAPVVLGTATVLALGCGQSGDSSSRAQHATTDARTGHSRPASSGARARARDRRLALRRRRAAARARARRLAAGCPARAHVLKGVYHPERLAVLNPCKRLRGFVVRVRHEDDGDLHFDVELARRDRGILLPGNYSRQGGALVVEFMPRDGGHLPPPSVGDQVHMVGALVDDTQHDWAELHPVWAIRTNGGSWSRSGPRLGGSPAGDRSYNAATDCRTSSGAACPGYGGASSGGPSPPRRSRHPTVSPPQPHGGGCEPGYSPCLPVTGDLNCADIPSEKKPVRVTGSDPYGLDRDGDGTGCDG